ncbi:hypothetical protein PIROE2DRAFT_57029 [Piromyces sp. E2]|nr:hypothetical protein PIROE2DRAFT_57029 [Piromyces sp. E2]|eukprot:OUM70165.1 hypothetical protein PIROE2DRAFT_57029 [Piromyces sp. E2]
MILIDLSGEEGEISETSNKKSSKSSNKRNLRSSSRINNKLKSELENSDSEKSDSIYNIRKKGKNILSDEDEIKSDKLNSKYKRQKRTIISDDSYSSSNSSNNNSNNKNNNSFRNDEKPKHGHNLRSHSKLKSDSIINTKIGEKNNKVVESSSFHQQRRKDIEKSTRVLRSNDVKITPLNSSKNSSDSESRNDSYNGESSIIHDLESMNIDDIPSGNIDSIEISSDDSDDDVLEIVPRKKANHNSNNNNEIEISDDENSKSNARKKSLRSSLPESSMKKSIELRSSRIKKKNENRSLALKRLKGDIKQRKKLYKAFKRLYKFCIAILVHEEYIKTNINELKKAFQIINKRINNVCKKITPVPPWTNKFQKYELILIYRYCIYV